MFYYYERKKEKGRQAGNYHSATRETELLHPRKPFYKWDKIGVEFFIWLIFKNKKKYEKKYEKKKKKKKKEKKQKKILQK